MDPTANLKEQLELSDWLLDDANYRGDHYADKALELAELVSALHHWIIRGGHLPRQWQQEIK